MATMRDLRAMTNDMNSLNLVLHTPNDRAARASPEVRRAAVSPRKTSNLSPPMRHSPPKLPTSPAVERLRALEEYVRAELAPLPRNSSHRLTAFRHVFNCLIAALPGHGPLLAEVKAEYEKTIESLASSSSSAAVNNPPSHLLLPTHPLQLPASYYEAEWRRAQAELNLAKSQVARLQKVVRRLRTGCREATRRAQCAGLLAPPASARREEEDYAAIEAAEARDRELADAGDAEAAERVSRAVVSEEAEAQIDLEIAMLRRQLGVLEQRVGGATRLSQLGKQAVVAARCTVEEVIDEGIAQARANEGGGGFLTSPKLSHEETAEKLEEALRVAEKRTSTLGTVHKMMRTQEEHFGRALELLSESGWDGIERTDELRELAQTMPPLDAP